MSQESKVCLSCNERKSFSEFYTKGKGRYENRCKACSKKNKKEKRTVKSMLKKRRRRVSSSLLSFSKYRVHGNIGNKRVDEFSKCMGLFLQEVFAE